MLTRAWYDYYVITPDPGSLTLAMRFYKWGDGTPENALAEYSRFRAQLHQHDNRLPVEWLDQVLREQLGNLHASLPPQFATAAFLFLMQRAAEALERDRWRRFDPPRQRPDAHLRFALDEAMAAEPFGIPPNPNPLLERVRRFIATARYLRPWRDYGLRLSLLDWLQYITQPTFSADMGSLAGDWEPPSDVYYRYRLFLWVDPQDPHRIDQTAIQLCRYDGTDLLTTPAPAAGPDHNAWQHELSERLRDSIREHDIGITSLALLQHEYPTTPDRFFRFHEQPDPEATARRARISDLRPSCNLLLRLIGKRFGPEVAAASRAIIERIDDYDLLPELADAVIDSPDGAAWLSALRERVRSGLGETQ